MDTSVRNNLLGKHLLKQSLFIAFCTTIIFSGLQIWINYTTSLALIEDTFVQIKNIQITAMTSSLWNFSMSEVAAQVDGITHFQFINYAEITDRGKIIAAAGQRKDPNSISREFPLIYDHDGHIFRIGTLYVQADQSLILNQVIRQVLQVITIQALIIFLVVLSFLALINRQVTSHLLTAAKYFQNFDINHLNIPLVLNKNSPKDEIDTLVNSFNEMRINLSESYQQRTETERKHATLLANLPGMAYKCNNDMHRTMLLVSAGCLGLTGYTSEQIIDKSFGSYCDLIHPDDRDTIWEEIQNGLEQSKSFEVQYRINPQNGEMKWVLERGIGIYSSNDVIQSIEGFIIDITEKRQQEREIEAIATISQALRTTGTKEEMLPMILNHTTKLLDADGGTLELLNPYTGDAIIEYANGVYESLIGILIPMDQGLNVYIRSTGKPYSNNHVDLDKMSIHPDIDRICRAAAGVPLIAQGNLLGFLWMGRKTDISQAAINTLSAIADIAANAIHRASLFQQTELQLLRLIGLRKIDIVINSNQELSFSLNLLVELTISILHVDAAEVLLLGADKRLHCESGQGFNATLFGDIPLKVEGSCSGQALLQRKYVEIRDIHEYLQKDKCITRMIGEGFSSTFIVPLIAKNEVLGVLQVYKRIPFTPEPDWIEFLETLGGQAAIAISESKLINDLSKSNLELELAYDNTIEGWSSALDLRDKETEGHSQRVTEVTLALSRWMNFSEDQLVNIRRGSLLHDIGKMGVPDYILFIPGKLSDGEWEVMRQHPNNAFQMLSPIKYLWPALDIPYCHHEKWDGTGYPRKIKGKKIPLPARIFAVVDVWDALTSDRPYRKAFSDQEAMDYIQEQSGRHFDPEVVVLFTKHFKEIIISRRDQ